MARMRSIKPEFWSDQKLTLLPRDVRLLYIALWNFADEEGRLQGDTRLVKSWCFPLDDDVNAAEIDKWLGLLADAGKLIRYEVDGGEFIHLMRLAKHQKLDPRLPSRLPPPPNPNQLGFNTDQSGRSCVEVDSPTNTGGPSNNESPHQLVGVSPGPEGAKHVAGGRGHVAGGVETPPRERDLIWDALLDACGINGSELTKTSRGPIVKAVADLKEAGATVNQIKVRARRYKTRFADAALTPMALAKHWPSLDASLEPEPRSAAWANGG